MRWCYSERERPSSGEAKKSVKKLLAEGLDQSKELESNRLTVVQSTIREQGRAQQF